MKKEILYFEWREEKIINNLTEDYFCYVLYTVTQRKLYSNTFMTSRVEPVRERQTEPIWLDPLRSKVQYISDTSPGTQLLDFEGRLSVGFCSRRLWCTHSNLRLRDQGQFETLLILGMSVELPLEHFVQCLRGLISKGLMTGILWYILLFMNKKFDYLTPY